MKIVSSLSDIHEESLYITAGNFDGVHRGHAEFIANMSKEALENDAKSVIVTFTPHPMFVLSPQDNFLLSDYEQKRILLENMGVDYLYEINFTRDFSTLDPTVFFDTYIFNNPKVTKLFLGHDFAFGANKSGDHSFAKDYCRSRSIDLTIQDAFLVDSERVSSTLIRNLVKDGDVSRANKFLGREFSLMGTVIKGMKRGRQLGFPTANIGIHEHQLIPKKGVYATRTLYGNIVYNSITNVGFNPTFLNEQKINVETHILDFNKDIYGESIEVSFLYHIRDERKFHSADELVEQMKNDIIQATS